MGKSYLKLFLLLFTCITALTLSYCKKRFHFVIAETLRIFITDTFTSAPLDGIPVEIDCGGILNEGVTHEGVVEFKNPEINPLLPPCDIKINFSSSSTFRNFSYIPVIVPHVNLEAFDTINLDLVKVRDINPEGYDWHKLLSIYRTGSPRYTNLKWENQPERWIVEDPEEILKKYTSPRESPEFKNIMKGFKIIEEYTDGALKAPLAETVEILYKKLNTPPQNSIIFKINTSSPPEAKEYFASSQVIISVISTNPQNTGKVLQYSISAVQGGINRSSLKISIMTGAGILTRYDKIWGKFNYKLRESGDEFRLHYMGCPIVEMRTLYLTF